MKKRCDTTALTLACLLTLPGTNLLQACASDSASSVQRSSSGPAEATYLANSEPSDVMTSTAEEGGAIDGGEASPAATAAECGDWACFPMPNSAATPPRPADYDTSDPEVVLDRVTGLLWQRMAATDEVKADGASNVCDELTLAGHADWRLPRLMELVSLIDHASDAPAGTVKTTAAISDSGPHDFWSASPAGTTGLWLASLSGGYVDAPSAAANARVRCVRTHESRATGSEHYTASGGVSGTVRDNWTGLVWQATATASEHSFAEAQTHCGTSTVAGGGWRVPSARELITLTDRASQEDMKIDSAFFSGTERNTWTSSPSTLLTASAWFVDFRLAKLDDLMVTGGDLIDQKFSVRCVR